MTTYVITAKVECPSGELVRELSHVTGRPVGDVHRALKAGAPIVSAYVLGNDHEDRRAVLRGVVKLLLDAGVASEASVYSEYEAPDQAERMSLPELIDALDEDVRERRRMLEFDDRTGHKP